MGTLIEAADLTPYGLTEQQISTPLVEVLIASASAEIRDAAGAPILSTRSTITRVQPPGLIFALPGLPIQEVHSVTVAGEELTDYLLTAGGLYREVGWGNPGPMAVTVDYTHGMSELPADIKDLCCRMVLTGVLNSVDGPEGLAITNGNVSSVSIDDFREAYATGAQVEAITEMTLPRRTRARLATRFGSGGAKVKGTW